MSSRTFVRAAVFVLCLVCVVGAVAQVQPTCDSLLNSKSAVQANANSGDAYVQFCLGLVYEAGQVVPRDYSKALAWYRKAAEQGEKYAQYNLGSMYNNGEGVTQDYAQAAAWYQKAAQKGNYQAQSNLGFMYSNGLGVTQNYAEAYYWFAVAASAETESAEQKQTIKLRDDAASHLTPAVLLREQKRVSEWFEDGD